jgi:acyl carrier protein
MDELREQIAQREEALARVRRILIEKLHVPLTEAEIDLDAPLFGTGLGLDSVDAVELVVAIETELSIRIPDGAAGPWMFRTVQSLVELVLEPPCAPEAAPAAEEVTS